MLTSIVAKQLNKLLFENLASVAHDVNTVCLKKLVLCSVPAYYEFKLVSMVPKGFWSIVLGSIVLYHEAIQGAIDICIHQVARFWKPEPVPGFFHDKVGVIKELLYQIKELSLVQRPTRKNGSTVLATVGLADRWAINVKDCTTDGTLPILTTRPLIVVASTKALRDCLACLRTRLGSIHSRCKHLATNSAWSRGCSTTPVAIGFADAIPGFPLAIAPTRAKSSTTTIGSNEIPSRDIELDATFLAISALTLLGRLGRKLIATFPGTRLSFWIRWLKGYSAHDTVFHNQLLCVVG